VESDDGNLTPQVLSRLWTMAKAKKTPGEPGLASFQKFMVMHEDMHEVWERLEKDPATSLDVDGENLLVHIAMDAATMRGLETNQPMGIANLYASLVKKGFDQSEAFHVLSQAMQHEFLSAASQGQEMEIPKFLDRATKYYQQAVEGKAKGGPA
jgi:hypothetical protein